MNNDNEVKLREEWNKMIDCSKAPNGIDEAEDWLKEHEKEHVWSNYVYGEPMFDLDADKVLDYWLSVLHKREREVREEATKEAMKIEWAKHIRFLREHKKGAGVAKDLLYHSEMSKALENSENWFKGMFGDVDKVIKSFT